MKPMKKVAILHSLCSLGKASLTNMIPILSVMSVEACPIPTILMSTHTGGYGAPAIHHVKNAYIREMADHYRENQVEFDAIFIGYLGSEEMVSSVQYFIEQFPKAIIILDPIMGDHGKCYSNLGTTYAESFRTLLPYADMLLPNLTEGCLLTNVPYTEQPDAVAIENICKILIQAGAKQLLMTSVPMDGKAKGMVLSDGASVETFTLTEVASDFHGTGDVFDAVFVGSYLQGLSLQECIRKAHGFVCACMEESLRSDYPKREGLAIEQSLSLLV